MATDPRYPRRWDWLYETRRNLGLTQVAFAREIGIHRPTYATIEAGHRLGTAANLKLIADYLGKTVSELDATRTPWAVPGKAAAA